MCGGEKRGEATGNDENGDSGGSSARAREANEYVAT
jgi:hypothetical protein